MFRKNCCLLYVVSISISLFFCLSIASAAEEDLAGYWPLDGDTKDASGNGNDGKISGNTSGNKSAAAAFTPPPPENVPPVTAELITALESRPPAEAQIVRQENGGYALEINGKPVPFFQASMRCDRNLETFYLEPYIKSGIDILLIAANLGFQLGYTRPSILVRPVWIGKDKYDFSDVEKVLWRWVSMKPEGNIIVWLEIDSYPEWPIENPGGVMMNEKGEKAIGTHHFYRYDSSPPNVEKFREDASKMIAAYVQYVEKTIPGRRIIGYLIGGGQDAQLYYWHPPDTSLDDPNMWSDYSPAARSAWKKWLRARYGNDITRMNKAWQTKLRSFEQADPPPAKALAGATLFHDPDREQQEIDWKFFIAEGRSSLINHFAEVIKKASSRKVIVGACSGEGGWRRELCSSSQILKNANIDFLFHQVCYHRRNPPGVGGINGILASHQLNGKFFIADMDHSTYLVDIGKLPAKRSYGDTLYQISTMYGVVTNIEGLRAMWRREFGLLWANGAGASIDHMQGVKFPWAYMDKPIIDELAFLRSTAATFLPTSPFSPTADVAVIYDEEAVHYLNSGLKKYHRLWSDAQQIALNKSGVPWRWYYAADLREGKIPQAKIYIFQNLLNIDNQMAAEIEKLKKGNALLVFLSGTGYAQSCSNLDRIRKTTGLNLERIDTAKGGGKLRTDHPLVNWRLAQSGTPPVFIPAQQGIIVDESTLYGVQDPSSIILSFYDNTSVPGFVLKEYGSWKSIFIGVHKLSSQMISALARFSGAWQLIDPDRAVCAARDDFIMIHPLQNGLFRVNLRKPGKLVSAPPFKILSEKAARHQLMLNAGNTYLFRVE